MSSQSCSGCGAPSPSAPGVCEFCGVQIESEPQSPHKASIGFIANYYNEGKLRKAFQLCNTLARENPEASKDPEFLILFAKVQLEIEAATSEVRAILGKAFANAASHPELQDYLDIVEAKSSLESHDKALGEAQLRKVIERSPKNFHALFALGSHLYWTEKRVDQAMHMLEKAVLLRPLYVRAWACLGTIYVQSGRGELAKAAYRKCVELEENPKMVSYFKKLYKQVA